MGKIVFNLGNLVEAPPSIESQLTALTPYDGRYAEKVYQLRNFCSEAGLQRLRTLVEVEYLIFYNQIRDESQREALENVYAKFTLQDAVRIKEIDREINHDVKAVEYFVGEKLDAIDLSHLKPKVHIFLTSEDVTNVAIGMMVYLARGTLLDAIDELSVYLSSLADKWKTMPMLARTHGQPASPTTAGKEFTTFANRVKKASANLRTLPITMKWNGATGNYNAHVSAKPEIDWIQFSQDFIEKYLGFTAELFTGQTNHYLYLADIFHQLKNLSSILIDLARDMWLYISYDNFKLKLKEGEVGSSAMPHKVNPIDFENAEGNLEIAEVLFGFMASKLQKSRLQRDLSDSTALRNLGLMFGSFLIGVRSILRGLEKIDINEQEIIKDLEDNPQVIAEAIQSVMREHGITNAYEQLKELTRGQVVTVQSLRYFVQNLDGLSDESREYLLNLTPPSYTGCALKLVDYFLDDRRESQGNNVVLETSCNFLDNC